MKTIVASLGLVVLLSAASLCGEEAPAAPGDEAPKIYGIYETSDADTMWALEDVRKGEFLGVPCITGRFVDASPFRGQVCHIPVDKVAAVVEFDSLKQLKKFLEEE